VGGFFGKFIIGY